MTTISLAAIRAAFSTPLQDLDDNKLDGQKDHETPLRLPSLAFGANILTRSIAWTQADDQELRSMFVRVTDGTAGRTVTATLTVDSTRAVDTKFLADNTFDVVVTTVIGTADARADFRDPQGKRVKLLKGVRYRLDVDTSAGPVTGPVIAGLQTRSVRRGGAGGYPIVPNAFRTRGNLDVEKLNENLLQASSDVADSVNARFTYSRAFFDLSGIADTDAAVLRQFAVRRPSANAALVVIGIELVGTDVDAGATWTASIPADTHYPTVSIDGDGANSEQLGLIDFDEGVPSSAADVVIEVGADTSSGKKINAGYLVVHFRCNRNDQGSANAGFAPTLFDSKSLTDEATFTAQTDALTAAVAADAAADHDLRVECFVARTLVAGTSRSWRLQGGARRASTAIGYVAGQVAGAGNKATFTVAQKVPTDTFDVLGTGAAARNVATQALTADLTASDPTAAGDDTVITIAAAVADIPLAFLLVVWS